jgi:hypothetical protein
MSERELLPCPSGIARNPDGHMAPIYTLGEGKWRVECVCGWRGPLADTIPEAIAAWNRRAPSAAEAEMREALTKSLEVNAMMIAFIGRDQGTSRMDATLACLVKCAVDLDAVLRAALSKETKSP